MATLKNIGTKIKTTKNIAKITNALEVVATIKLQKIKKDTEAFKKYVLSVLNVALEVFSYSKDE
jgi:F0F1-type ATP synthase gamma subunit